MASARQLAAGLVVVALAAAGCSGSGTADDATPAFGWDEGDVLLPPFAAEDFRMWRIAPQEPTSVPVVVTSVDGDTIVAAVLDDASAEWPDGLPDLSPGWVEPGPTVQGRPSVLSQGDAPFQIRGAVVFHVDEETVVVASRTAPPEVLVDVAQGVRLPLDGPGSVPGDLVGVLPAEVGPSAEYSTDQGDDGEIGATFILASPSVQAAYRALLIDDPTRSIDEATEASCCDDALLAAPRTFTVDDRTATIGTLTPYRRAVIVPGDPGVVILSHPTRGSRRAPTDAQLEALAAGIVTGSPDDLLALYERSPALEREAAARRNRASLDRRGIDVLVERPEDAPRYLVTASQAPQPLFEVDGPAVCAVWIEGQVASCVTEVPEATITGGTRGDILFGAVEREVDRVRVLVADWELDAELIEVDAGRGLPQRLFLVALDDEQQMDLFERATITGDAVFVALDADGNELGRVAVPLLPVSQR